jgi:hypothetical protein
MRFDTFWIAADISAKDAPFPVSRREDATAFTPADAQNYVNSLKQRAREVAWSIEPLVPDRVPYFLRPLRDLSDSERFVIKGVQLL